MRRHGTGSERSNSRADQTSRDSVKEKLKSLAIDSSRILIAERHSNIDRPYNSREVTKVSQATQVLTGDAIELS